ncbi:MAG: FtsH protease activity modulator HflK [Candidatus Loosdrechtia sp.]|uniref:FtsH protease activity modulator HflK n=1 Tax=Candidatus Loosdrechtia sp. TaxID=3101272 RepID=UPI00403AB141
MDQWQHGREGNNPQPWKDAEEIFRRFLQQPKRWMFVFLAVIIAVWLVFGIYTVGPGEVGVVRLFGREVTQTSSGLRYRLPWPIQSVSIVDVSTIRSAEIGYRTVRAGKRSVPNEALMLTGDENIVEINLFVQYLVKDPSQFLFRARDPEEILKTAAEISLRGVVGQHPIDYTMTEGRADVELAVHSTLQQLLDRYETGLLVREARLLVVDPPQQVIDAFHEVVRALEDRERLVQEARAYEADIVPRARGEAARMLASAEAYRERRTLEAAGDVAEFSQVFKEYDKARNVTRERLYLEMIDRTLSGLNMMVIDEELGGQTLPLLPLDQLLGKGGSL